MNFNFEKFRRAIWTFKQPLTKIPVNGGMPISDMFVWRNSKDWKTFFELMDIAGLFIDSDSVPERCVSVLFFDSGGKKILEERVRLIPNRRITLDLSKYLSATDDEIGTFCVFHSFTPQEIINLHSFITERGYVSYQYKYAPVRSFVHGNLDAIVLNKDNEVKLLGGPSFLSREYRVQHELLGPSQYELIFVNPTVKSQKLTCRILPLKNSSFQKDNVRKIAPMGIAKFDIQLDESCSYRIIVKSNLVMARPIVCRIQNQKLDVFHG